MFCFFEFVFGDLLLCLGVEVGDFVVMFVLIEMLCFVVINVFVWDFGDDF